MMAGWSFHARLAASQFFDFVRFALIFGLEAHMETMFTKVATRCANWMGQPQAFVVAVLACLVWAVTGPVFHYSDTWQLVINTGTTVLTFLAVFLIQNSQNRDGAAIQAKLDELMRAIPRARPEFIGIEHLTDAEICAIRDALEHEEGRGNANGVAPDGPNSPEKSVDELLHRR